MRKYFHLLPILFLLTACWNSPSKFCGNDFNNAQIKFIEKARKLDYTYTKANFQLLGKLSAQLNQDKPDTDKIECYLFHASENSIGIITITADSLELKKSISCLIMGDELNDFLPKNRYLILFNKENNDEGYGVANNSLVPDI